MPQIDLKFATFKVKDGYAVAGAGPAVNNALGYPATTATMVVDGITGVVAVGDTFKLAAHATTYRVTAHTETTGNTTSITFTPGLVDAALDNDLVHFQPHSLEIRIGEGNLTYDEKRKMEYTLNRGKLDTVRQGNEEPVDVRFDFMWEFLSSASGDPPTIQEALKREGAASAWVSTDDDPCQPYAVDIEVVYTPDCPGIDNEVITLPLFRWEGMNHDAKAGTVAVTGKCNVIEASYARGA